MTLFHRTRRTAMALCAAALCVTAVSANHSWGGYHWARTSNPVVLQVGDNVNSTWDAYLNEAIGDWNQSAVLDLRKVAGGSRSKNCRPTAGRIEVCNGSYGNNGWLGVAQVWVSGKHITQATTRLNDTYFNTSTYNAPEWRRLVTCQEVGHDFGLDHQDENFDNPNLGTCMDYTRDPNGPPSNEHPNQHDYEELNIIYNHLDNTTTAGQTVTGNPAAMDELDLEGPGQWGRKIRSTNSGRTELFELDFGHGRRVFTFVIWADGPRGGR